MDSKTKLRIFTFITVFIFGSPLVGWGTATLAHQSSPDSVVTEPAERTNGELQTVLETERKSLQSDLRFEPATVTGHTRLHTHWYVVDVRSQNREGGTTQQKALIGDFYQSASRMIVVLNPGERFDRENISNGIGVPYDVIDALYQDRKDPS